MANQSIKVSFWVNYDSSRLGLELRCWWKLKNETITPTASKNKWNKFFFVPKRKLWTLCSVWCLSFAFRASVNKKGLVLLLNLYIFLAVPLRCYWFCCVIWILCWKYFVYKNVGILLRWQLVEVWKREIIQIRTSIFLFLFYILHNSRI